MLVNIPRTTYFLFFSLDFLRSFTFAQNTEAPVTGPPVTMAPVTAAPVDTTPSASPSEYSIKSDFRCGTDSDDAKNSCGNICQFPTDCEQGLFCFGTWNKCYVEEDSVMTAKNLPLTPELEARSDFRCGVSEVDARSNCKKECTVSTDCDNDAGETCWGTHNSYCHIMPENHPQCDYEEAENINGRCGYDEMAARGFCGAVCNNEVDCVVPGEKCFPVHLNLCLCFEEEDRLNAVVPPTNNRNLEQNTLRRHLDNTELVIRETNREYFERAKEPINEYLRTNYPKKFVDNETTSSAKKNQTAWFGFIGSSLLAISLLLL